MNKKEIYNKPQIEEILLDMQDNIMITQSTGGGASQDLSGAGEHSGGGGAAKKRDFWNN